MIFFGLETFPLSPGRERQASLSVEVCSPRARILGFIMTNSSRSSRLVLPDASLPEVSRWLTAAIRMGWPTCGAASQTPSCSRISSRRAFHRCLMSGVIFLSSGQTVLRICLSSPVTRGYCCLSCSMLGVCCFGMRGLGE